MLGERMFGRLKGVPHPLERLGAMILLVWMAPLVLILGFAVCGREPIFFKQVRVGRGGRRFHLVKLRTMRVDAPELLLANPELQRRYVNGGFKLQDEHDPRLLPLGAWIRRTGLDELPQLWNVARGEMRLVGPRPIVPDELSVYPDYGRIMEEVAPGITCLWQVSDVPSADYQGRAALDRQYMQTRTLALDVKILCRTITRALRARVSRVVCEQQAEPVS